MEWLWLVIALGGVFAASYRVGRLLCLRAVRRRIGYVTLAPGREDRQRTPLSQVRGPAPACSGLCKST